MIWRALILVALLAASPVGAESWLPPRADLAAMPASGNVSGDARLSLADGQVYYWTGSAWSALASGSGTVSSVALAAPSLFTISGSPVTTTGTLTLALATQSANTVFAGPTTGSAAAPTMRALVAADLPAATTSNRGGVVLSTDGEATAGEAVQATDARLTDARTPSAHASSHAAAGSDPVTLAQSQVTNLASDLAGKAAASHAHAAADITSGQLGVANGGTGVASLTAYAPVCGGITSTGAVQSCSTGIDTTGYVLTSNGPSALPSWQAASGGGAAGADTQVTFNNAGTAAGDSGLTFNATSNTLTASGVNLGTIAAGQGIEANGFTRPYIRLIGSDSDMWLASDKLTLTSGSGRFGELTHDRLGFGRDTCVAFFNHPDPAQGSADSGFCRSAAGILWATDGSTGVGFWRDAPTDSPPTCGDTTRGAHYFDDSLGEECSCKGATGAASWQQMDGGGAC